MEDNHKPDICTRLVRLRMYARVIDYSLKMSRVDADGDARAAVAAVTSGDIMDLIENDTQTRINALINAAKAAEDAKRAMHALKHAETALSAAHDAEIEIAAEYDIAQLANAAAQQRSAQADAELAETQVLLSDLQLKSREVINDFAELQEECRCLMLGRDSLIIGKDVLTAHNNVLLAEREAYLAERCVLVSERDGFKHERDNLADELARSNEKTGKGCVLQ